jgi:hypothetical protein
MWVIAAWMLDLGDQTDTVLPVLYFYKCPYHVEGTGARRGDWCGTCFLARADGRESLVRMDS